ncbi:MAG: branched-chain-amino-acid transaminase [Cyclobacteriaceae bacterium]|nr:branched-chain-amino-acid transaminase [Cyclobacteriaceae bacterium]
MYFSTDSTVFLDGNWIHASEANVTLYSQTLHYGFGVFDGMRSYKNADGCNIFKAREHFARLSDSCRQLGIQLSYTPEELVEIAYQLLTKNHLYTAYIRPLVFLGPNMELNSESSVHVFMAAWPWKKYLGYEPINIMVSQYQKQGDNHSSINAKIVGNYAPAILATNQARKLGYDEALLLDENGCIAEGPAANFFYEKDDILYTPTTRCALPGITRKTIFDLAAQWDIPVVEKDITVEEAYKADYAFFTGTASEITPIGSINGERMKKSWEDSHAYSLYMMYRQQVMYDEFQGLTIV